MTRATLHSIEGQLVHTSSDPHPVRVFSPDPAPVYVPVMVEELTRDQESIARIMRDNRSRNFS